MEDDPILTRSRDALAEALRTDADGAPIGSLAALYEERKAALYRREAEDKQHEQRLAGLLGEGPRPGKTLAEFAEEGLRQAGGPVHRQELARIVEALGFRHSRSPKNPQQLEHSLGALVSRDPRFVRVGRGLFDLAERVKGRDEDKSRNSPAITAGLLDRTF